MKKVLRERLILFRTSAIIEIRVGSTLSSSLVRPTVTPRRLEIVRLLFSAHPAEMVAGEVQGFLYEKCWTPSRAVAPEPFVQISH